MGLDDISPAEEYALELVAASNSGGRVMPVPEGLWPEVSRELRAQTVLLAPIDLVGDLGLSETETGEYVDLAMQAIARWHGYMGKMALLLEEFRKADIPVAVLKGAAAAMSYPYPERRTMGDIDLIVAPEFFDRADDLMRRLGWVIDEGHERSEEDQRHLAFSKEGCPTVELHRYFSNWSNAAHAEEVDCRIFEGVAEVTWEDVGGYSVPVLPTVVNGLVFLSHIQQHLGFGLGLRQMLDWHMYVEAYLGDRAWEQEFQQAARAIGLETLAITATAVCRDYLGLQRVMTWCDGADRQTVDDLACYVVRKGNMGRKVEFGARATRTILHQFRNPVSAVKYLAMTGGNHWEPARKHPWLAPAAVVYQSARLVRKGLERGVDMGVIAGDARTSQEEADLLHRLGVL